jgi:hypothetical protein
VIVRFDSAAGQFLMNGEVAVALLRHMGHSGAVPGALLAADLPAAISRLEAAVAPLPPAGPLDEASGEPGVNLRQRAFPMLELLRRAASKGCDVLWDKA